MKPGIATGGVEVGGIGARGMDKQAFRSLIEAALEIHRLRHAVRTLWLGTSECTR